MGDFDELIDDFVIEAKEHLGVMEKELLVLEKNPQDADEEQISTIFRSIHSIKGAAGFLGLERLSALSHVMETLLSRIRDGIFQPQPIYIDALFGGMDILNIMMANIHQSNKVDITASVCRLEALINPQEKAVAAARKEPELSLSETAPEQPEITLPETAPERTVQAAGSKTAAPERRKGAPPEPSSSGESANKHEATDTIRIPVVLLDQLMRLAGELVLVRNQHILSVDTDNPVVRGISQRLDIVTSELQETIMRTRMQPIGNVFAKLPRIVRDLARKLNKKIEIVTKGDEVELDKTILEALADPLTHLIRNCCDHGVEMPAQREKRGKAATGTILVQAFHEAGKINILIKDDGGGINSQAVREKAISSGFRTEEELDSMTPKELAALILLPGFSTAKKVSDVSGRGVGMDVVKNSLEQFSGILDLDSKEGEGTTVTLQLPLTLAIIPCLIVIVHGARYAIPQVNLEELVCLYDDDIQSKIECAGKQEVYRLRDQLLPMVRFSEVMASPEPFTEERLTDITEYYTKQNQEQDLTEQKTPRSLVFAVVEVGTKRFGLIVDQVVGTEEIVVHPMHPAVKDLRIYSGSTVMGDGRVALILDIEGISKHAAVEAVVNRDEDAQDKKLSWSGETQNVLLFRNGPQEQFAISLPLIRRIEHIAVADIELAGHREFVTLDGISTLIVRLDRVLDVSVPEEQERVFLLLPKHVTRPFGILMTSLSEVCETPLDMNDEIYVEDGLLGSAVIKEHLTLFLDVYRLVEKAEPEWFEQRKKNAPPPEEQKTILLLEDMPFFRKLVKGYLEADHYSVLTAEHGQAGLDILATNEVDMIVSDLEMPVLNGFLFMEQVRADEKYRTLPALALSSLSAPADIERAMAAGFNNYESKIDRDKLLTTIAGMV